MTKAAPFNTATLLTVMGEIGADVQGFENRHTTRFLQEADTLPSIVDWLDTMQSCLYIKLGLRPVNVREEVLNEIPGEPNVHIDIHLMFVRMVMTVVEMVERGPLDPLETTEELAKKVLGGVIDELKKKLGDDFNLDSLEG